MLVALAALFIALGGTAIAARHYLITSTSQIKPSVLRSLRHAGTSGLPGTSGSPGLTGTRGPEGPRGLEGPAGPTLLGAEREVHGPSETIGAGEEGFSFAECPEGESVVSGGGSTGGGLALTGSYANIHLSGWIAAVGPGPKGSVTAFAICAPTARAVAP